eukprot:1156080-Pelagomonas_calceolata.AAC.7
MAQQVRHLSQLAVLAPYRHAQKKACRTSILICLRGNATVLKLLFQLICRSNFSLLEESQSSDGPAPGLLECQLECPLNPLREMEGTPVRECQLECQPNPPREMQGTPVRECQLECPPHPFREMQGTPVRE